MNKVPVRDNADWTVDNSLQVIITVLLLHYCRRLDVQSSEKTLGEPAAEEGQIQMLWGHLLQRGIYRSSALLRYVHFFVFHEIHP